MAASLHHDFIAHRASPEHGPLPERHPEPCDLPEIDAQHCTRVIADGENWRLECRCGFLSLLELR